MRFYLAPMEEITGYVLHKEPCRIYSYGKRDLFGASHTFWDA